MYPIVMVVRLYSDNLTYAIGNLVTSKLNLTERNIYDMMLIIFRVCENFKEELTKIIMLKLNETL